MFVFGGSSTKHETARSILALHSGEFAVCWHLFFGAKYSHSCTALCALKLADRPVMMELLIITLTSIYYGTVEGGGGVAQRAATQSICRSQAHANNCSVVQWLISHVDVARPGKVSHRRQHNVDYV